MAAGEVDCSLLKCHWDGVPVTSEETRKSGPTRSLGVNLGRMSRVTPLTLTGILSGAPLPPPPLRAEHRPPAQGRGRNLCSAELGKLAPRWHGLSVTE